MREKGARWEGGKVASVCVIRRPELSSWLKYLARVLVACACVLRRRVLYQARQCSAKISRSLEATPLDGVADLFRWLGGGVGLPFLVPLERPEKEGEVGESTRAPDLGLVGGDIDVVEGRS